MAKQPIIPYDEDLLELLKQYGNDRANRKAVLDSRKLPIIQDNGNPTTTCVLPLSKYDELRAMKISYRTLAYRKYIQGVLHGNRG